MRGGALMIEADAEGKGVSEQQFWIPEELVGFLLRLKAEGRQSVFFPWCSIGHYRGTLCDTFKKIVIAAGIPPDRQWGLHAIRKGVLREMAYISTAAAQKLAGHQQVATLLNHYVNGDVVQQAQRELTPPPAFAAFASRKRGKPAPNQRTLF